jgi:hypothetical protein
MMLFQLQKLYSTEWDEKISQYVPIWKAVLMQDPGCHLKSRETLWKIWR